MSFMVKNGKKNGSLGKTCFIVFLEGKHCDNNVYDDVVWEFLLILGFLKSSG